MRKKWLSTVLIVLLLLGDVSSPVIAADASVFGEEVMGDEDILNDIGICSDSIETNEYIEKNVIDEDITVNTDRNVDEEVFTKTDKNEIDVSEEFVNTDSNSEKVTDESVNTNIYDERDERNEIIEDELSDDNKIEDYKEIDEFIVNTQEELSIVDEASNEMFEKELLQTASDDYYDVTGYGADGTDEESDSKVIQELLNKSLTSEDMITVYIPAGTYYIDSTLYVYSNTKLSLDTNAIIKRKNGFSDTMLLNGSADENVQGGYERSSNIILEGGIWDGQIISGNRELKNTIYFGHATGITIKDTTIKNCYGGHLIELTGVSDAEILNVHLSGFIAVEDEETSSAKEALQLDVTTREGSELFLPYDNTPCSNITISNCTFSDYPCGVGSHSAVTGIYTSNIDIVSNVFENMSGNQAICVNNYSDFTISNNVQKVANGVLPTVFAFISDSEGEVSNNTFSGAKENGIYVVNGSNVVLNGNIIGNCGLSGIRATKESTVYVSGGKIENCNNGGIYIDNSAAEIKETTISNCLIAGISIENPITALVSNNTINNNPAKGIGISSGNNATMISNNTITNSKDFPIFIWGANGTTISNNDISEFPEYGIWLKEFQDNSKSNNVQISNNRIDGGTAGIAVRNSINTEIDGNSITGASVWDIGVYDNCVNSIITNNTYATKLLIADTSAQQSNNISYSQNGLFQSFDGAWYYYRNGVVDTSYNSLAKNDAGWWYVKNGKVDFSYTGLAYYNSTWWYIKNGKLDFSYTGLVLYGGTWYYVNKGILDWNYTGLVLYGGTWYYVNKSILDWNYTGLVLYGGTWYYVNKGILDWNYTGLVLYGGTWYCVKKGILDWNYSSVVKYGSAWYYVKDGRVNFTYTGLAQNEYGWWYINKGKVDFSVTSVVQYNGNWWYVENGQLKFSYTGIGKNASGWWYISKGLLDWNYSGKVVYQGRTYSVVKGKVIH